MNLDRRTIMSVSVHDGCNYEDIMPKAVIDETGPWIFDPDLNVERKLATAEAELAKCCDQYKDLEAHYMEIKEQRDALMEGIAKFIYHVTTTHLDMGGKHSYHLKPSGYRAFERLYALIQQKSGPKEG